MYEQHILGLMSARANAVRLRTLEGICQRINTRTDTQRLDDLFTVNRRACALLRRIRSRYEAIENIQELRSN